MKMTGLNKEPLWREQFFLRDDELQSDTSGCDLFLSDFWLRLCPETLPVQSQQAEVVDDGSAVPGAFEPLGSLPLILTKKTKVSKLIRPLKKIERRLIYKNQLYLSK